MVRIFKNIGIGDSPMFQLAPMLPMSDVYIGRTLHFTHGHGMKIESLWQQAITAII